MNSFAVALTFHVLAATIWTGGHIVLAVVILPRVLRDRASEDLLKFESGYERIGIPALLIQVISGIWLANHLVPGFANWFEMSNPAARLILIKLLLLMLTAGFAVDARLRVIPNLSEHNLVSLAWHIIPVTIISVLFVIVGVAFRTGWLY
ncbi:MAG: copper resistance protein CopD [Gammaproteobacteria bacterium]|jgi:putative copper export protein|nr:copper resistance protein CopD [Gammaproteobacteria bacterium]